jgi:hypothetical protein
MEEPTSQTIGPKFVTLGAFLSFGEEYTSMPFQFILDAVETNPMILTIDT